MFVRFWSGLAQDVERELNNYIRGQGMVSLIMGVLFAIGFTIIGFPMAIGMGILIGILNLVPYLHTLRFDSSCVARPPKGGRHRTKLLAGVPFSDNRIHSRSAHLRYDSHTKDNG